MILDTCALLWLAQGGGRLSASTLARIDAEPVVLVSAICGFEIGVKVAKGKLSLPARPSDWFETVVQHHHLRVLPVDLATAIRATELPSIHSDPVDRMVIAAAQLQSLTVVTSDRVFDRYDVETIL